jgi:hypothetical protein
VVKSRKGGKLLVATCARKVTVPAQLSIVKQFLTKFKSFPGRWIAFEVVRWSRPAFRYFKFHQPSFWSWTLQFIFCLETEHGQTDQKDKKYGNFEWHRASLAMKLQSLFRLVMVIFPALFVIAGKANCLISAMYVIIQRNTYFSFTLNATFRLVRAQKLLPVYYTKF